MSIRILSGEVIDRIAAGEVLDRPANMVKELVENSLDAGADEIEIDFAAGGRRVIVRDNGSGLSREDLSLALQRHATSKIEDSDDLFRLNSFGFRGEALASIAAVSRLSMTTRERESTRGFRLESDFGTIAPIAEISARPGTEVRVTDLFENVPARLKFLKSDGAENAQIKTTLKALALAHENVAFRVRLDGELVFNWPKSDFKSRSLNVLGVEHLYSGELDISGLRAQVLVSAPQASSNVNRNLWFFCQRRWIQDRGLGAAVLEAYRNLLMVGQYPTAVVRLTCAPDAVDVNVHPAKSQVKFRDTQAAFRVTNRAIRQVLEKAPWLSFEVPPPPIGYHFEPQEDQETLSMTAPEFNRTQYPEKAFPLARSAAATTSSGSHSASVTDSDLRPPTSDLRPPTSELRPPNSDLRFPAQDSATIPFRWSDLQVIGQTHRTYILAQSQEALYLVDQHAAHERVVFERLMDGFRRGKIEMQTLLIPLVLDLPATEVEALIKHREAIEKFGLHLERMGPDSVAVQTIPALVKEGAIAEALRRLSFELSEDLGDGAWERAVGEVFASMACHSVIRAGQSISVEEMKSLLEQMDQFPLSSFCPHGRPVYVKRRFAEIEREFGRIV